MTKERSLHLATQMKVKPLGNLRLNHTKTPPSNSFRCVECGAPVKSLYTKYSKDNVRLTQCGNCKKFADKYVEHDYVLIFIDLVLIKPQADRHLLFNSLVGKDDRLHPSIQRLAILLLLFDVYLVWARCERHLETSFQGTVFQLLSKSLIYLCLCICQTAALHRSLWLAAKWILGYRNCNRRRR